MFAYLRYFSIASLILVVVAALAVGMYFRQIAADDLVNVVEQNNVSLSQGFINTIWRRYDRLFNEILADVPTADWPGDKRFIRFSRDAFRYFEGLPIAKVNIYNGDGAPFLSTDQSEIIVSGKQGALLFSQGSSVTAEDALTTIKAGRIYSRIIPEGTIKAPDGSLTTGSLVQTLVPILSEDYVAVVADSDVEIEGYIEVYFDVTRQWQQLDQFQLLGTSGIILIFSILLSALVFTAKRAETIIAKQHEKNLELASAKARAESENREKSRFLANISHELRTPLNAIIGFSEIIKNQSLGPLGNDKYNDYVRDIHSSGVHLLSLINDILDYSKAEAGKLELEISEIDAIKIVKTSMRLVSTRAEEAGVNLVEELPSEHFVLQTDAKKLKQILLNLLSNAVKFTPQGGSVTLSAWQSVTDESVTLQVRDTGIGIAPKDISKAMSPFGQVDSELSRQYEGTGLGLPLTKKLTEVMGGTFSIQSELGEGTTITITLPRAAPEQNVKKGPNVKTQEENAQGIVEESQEVREAFPAAIAPSQAEVPAQSETDMMVPQRVDDAPEPFQQAESDLVSGEMTGGELASEHVAVEPSSEQSIAAEAPSQPMHEGSVFSQQSEAPAVEAGGVFTAPSPDQQVAFGEEGLEIHHGQQAEQPVADAFAAPQAEMAGATMPEAGHSPMQEAHEAHAVEHSIQSEAPADQVYSPSAVDTTETVASATQPLFAEQESIVPGIDTLAAATDPVQLEQSASADMFPTTEATENPAQHAPQELAATSDVPVFGQPSEGDISHDNPSVGASAAPPQDTPMNAGDALAGTPIHDTSIDSPPALAPGESPLPIDQPEAPPSFARDDSQAVPASPDIGCPAPSTQTQSVEEATSPSLASDASVEAVPMDHAPIQAHEAMPSDPFAEPVPLAEESVQPTEEQSTDMSGMPSPFAQPIDAAQPLDEATPIPTADASPADAVQFEQAESSFTQPQTASSSFAPPAPEPSPQPETVTPSPFGQPIGDTVNPASPSDLVAAESTDYAATDTLGASLELDTRALESAPQTPPTDVPSSIASGQDVGVSPPPTPLVPDMPPVLTEEEGDESSTPQGGAVTS